MFWGYRDIAYISFQPFLNAGTSAPNRLLQGTGIPLQLYKVHAKHVWFSFRKQYSLTV